MNHFRGKIIAILLIITPCLAFSTTDNSTRLEVHLKARATAIEQAGEMDGLIATAGDKKLVLLGESTHGSHEFYVARAAISRGLVADHGFDFIAVEGDFPAIYELNRYVKDLPGAASSPRAILESFKRYPSWMWGNEEFLALVKWLRHHNDQLPPPRRVGLYGMDVYNEWSAKDAVLAFLLKHNIETHNEAKKHYSCFAPYDRNSWNYARAVQNGAADCSSATLDAVTVIKNARPLLPHVDNNEYFFVLQNAKVKHNAEKFYRKAQASRHADAWNARASHMHDTVTRLLALYGANSKGIVWAHNSHIGDASYTSMSAANKHNIGQLSRKHWGSEQVLLVGFSTHQGTVKASQRWGSTMEKMIIPEAQTGSVEDLFNNTGIDAFYLIFNDDDRNNPDFMSPRGHRAVGVVYNPDNDQQQYLNTVLPMRYDAFVYFDSTAALNPLIKQSSP